MNIDELIAQAYATAKEKGFHDEARNPKELLMLAISECGEAVEAHRKGMTANRQLPVTNAPTTPPEWRQCHCHEDYEVNDHGEVRSKDMRVDNGNGSHIKTGKILSPGVGGTGYNTVSLRGKTFKVARLVAGAFLDKPAGSDVVNHINGVKTDDYVANLEWITHSENNSHATTYGLRDMKKVFSFDDRALVLIDLRSMSVVDVAEKWGAHPSAIKRIRKEYGNLFSYLEYELADVVIRVADMMGYWDFRIPHVGGTHTVGQLFSIGNVRWYENVGEALFEISRLLTVAATNPRALSEVLQNVSALAHQLKIDIDRHVELKMAYNKTREHKHGKSY